MPNVALMVVVAAGCHRVVGIDDEVRARDARVVDAPPDQALDALGEYGFMKPRQLSVLSSGAFDADPTLPSDMTEIYFKSSRTAGSAGGDDIWYSTRATADDGWAPPLRWAESTADHERDPRIAPDGLTLWFTRTPFAGGPSTIMVATRKVRDNPWQTSTPVTGLDTSLGDRELVSTSPTQTVAYLTSQRGGKRRVFRTTRATTTAPWGTPVEVSELIGDEVYIQSPWVTPDDLSIIVTLDRAGCAVGGGDLRLATRASTLEPFGPLICIDEIATLAFDLTPWISPDLRHIYFASTAAGGYDLWEAHR